MNWLRYCIGGVVFCFGLFLEEAAHVVCTLAVLIGYGFKESKEYWNGGTP